MLYWVNSWPMRAVLEVLSPGTALSLRMAGRPATLKVRVLKVPVVWAREKGKRERREKSVGKERCMVNVFKLYYTGMLRCSQPLRTFA